MTRATEYQPQRPSIARQIGPATPATHTFRQPTQPRNNLYYSTDLEADDGGYTVSDPSSSWEWGAVGPYTGTQDPFPIGAYTGTNVWATNLTGDYGNEENATLTSPSIDLSSAVFIPGYQLWLQWYQWMYNENVLFDWGEVEVRGGTADWQLLNPPGRMGGLQDPEWTKYAVDISEFASVDDFQLRFHFYSDSSLVYPGWYIDDIAIWQQEPPPGVYLSPDNLEVVSCNGVIQDYALVLVNLTGSDATFDLTYRLQDPAYSTVTGPLTVSLSHSGSTSLVVSLAPTLCLPSGLELIVAVEAAGNGYSDTTVISQTISTGGFWQQIPDEPGDGRLDNVAAAYDGLVWSITGYGTSADVRTYAPSTHQWTTVPTSAPPFGPNHARSGCQITDTVYVYGDSVTPGFTGLWAYNMESNTWHQPAPAGTGPAHSGIWAPAWAYDPEENRCYLTGGGTTPGAGDLSTTYTYDPVANAWLSPTLDGFDTPREFHAAWVVDSATIPKLLCVAGGTGASDLDSTQCYDLSTGRWNSENHDLGPLPGSFTAIGYTEKRHGTTADQLWIVGGREAGTISRRTITYDVNAGAWQDGPNLAGGAIYRTAAVVLEDDNAIYRLGGSRGGSLPTSAADRYVPCPTCADVGWLHGHVYDYDTSSAPCTAATVAIVPENIDVTVSSSGYYGVPLIPFTYQALATASGYPAPVGPVSVTVIAGAVTTHDFWLDRPDIAITPAGLIAEAVSPQTVTQYVTITNRGSYTLGYEVREMQSSEIPKLALVPRVTAQASTSVEAGVQVEPELARRMDDDGAAGYMIYFREQPDLSPAFGMDWVERGRFVAQTLQETATRSQAQVRAYLDARGIDYQAFWIDNVIVVDSSSRNTFDSLTTFPEIEFLRTRRQMHVIPSQQPVPTLAPSTVEPNISHIQADRVWDMGYRGEGTVVANIDTGVRYTHNALEPHYRGSLGNGSYDHDYNWLDADTGNPAPSDDHGHGSHTMGIMIGDDGGTNQIGVAPGGQWIACDACSSGGGCPDGALLTCAQWILAPYPVGSPSLPDPDKRPHVVNNSWGDCTTSYDDWFQDAIDGWHAAGIYPVFSNGNASNCDYPTPPGCNTVGNPARYGNVTGVGSTGQSSGQYAPHSCWGPTDNPDAVNPRTFPTIKPQVVAPGVNIRSSLSGGDALYGSWSGTSMSAPHVAALIGLMWQAAPCLIGDYGTTETLIEETATPIPYITNCAGGGEGPDQVPNHATGWGEINGPAAVERATSYCKHDWLPWVKSNKVTDTVPTGDRVVEVSFSCDVTATLEPQPLQGTLLVKHDDPCSPPVEIDLTFFCAGHNPSPIWTKEVRVNGVEQPTVEGPHDVQPGDAVVIIDRVGAASSKTITSVLTETWNSALELVAVDAGGVGSVRAIGGGTVLLPQNDSLVWRIENVAPNTFYPITKTFRVRYGGWEIGLINESYGLQDGLVQREDIVVTFTPHEAAMSLRKNGPRLFYPTSSIPLALVIEGDDEFYSNAALTDILPTGMAYGGGITTTYGRAWAEDDVIYWTNYTSTVPPPEAEPVDAVRDGGFEAGTPNGHWSEASINYGTPLCDAATCGTGGGSGPHSGDWWAWFGGTTVAETGSLAQDLTIPPGEAELSFWLEIPAAGTGGILEASIDNVVLFSVMETDAPSYIPYELITLDISEYGDGDEHTLKFESSIDAGSSTTNFFVDDVSLIVYNSQPMPGSVTITFDVFVFGTDEVCNVAVLNWTDDFTGDEHCVRGADHKIYMPIVMRNSWGGTAQIPDASRPFPFSGGGF